MLKKTLVIVSVMAVVLTMGITAFAFTPDVDSFLPKIGGWQIGGQNSAKYYRWNAESCPTCGVRGYFLSDESNTPYYDSVQMGDVFAVSDATDATADFVNDSGVVAYFTTEDPHDPSAHRDGLFCLTTYGEIFTTLSKNTNAFRGIIGGFHRIDSDGKTTDVWERVEPIYSTNCRARNTCVYYATSTFAVPLYNNEINSYIEAIGENSYNDGLINGTQNSNAYLYIGEVIDGVTNTVLDALYDINIMGVSLLHLVYLVLATFLIMFIIKITRGA